MPMERFEERRLVEFKNQGLKIFGVLHLPVYVKPAPAVLFCHGLAGNKIGKHRMYVILSERLSRAGIASLRFDFRGSGDSEGNFSDMSLQGEVCDAVKALEFLSLQPGIDPMRIGILGRSFGGAIAVIAAYRFQKIKSIALWAPVFNANQWEEKWEMSETNKIDEKQRRELMRVNGQLPSMSFYRELFSMNIDQEMRSLQDVPFFIIHGEQDPIVSIEHAKKYIASRKQQSITEFVKLPHSDHDFNHPKEKEQAIDDTRRWFAKRL
ncbi:MAG: alpha/beta fold hydrolase [Waddliaceae bacterium]